MWLLALIPGILSAAIAVVTPWLQLLSELLVGLLKRCWEGFTDVMDNLSTIIFVLVLVMGTAAAVKYDSWQDCRDEKAALTKSFKKKPATTTRPVHQWIPW
jgi:hypothetical protein